jgi:3-hydroxyisobutyrate dehydrogenase
LRHDHYLSHRTSHRVPRHRAHGRPDGRQPGTWRLRRAVWNRTASRAAALAEDGAAIAGSPAEAVKGAGIVITMLADGPATEQSATGPDGFLPGAAGQIWVQMATIGTDWTARLADTAARHGVTLVDAPVSGSQGRPRLGS